MRLALQTSGAEYVRLATCVAAIGTYDQLGGSSQHNGTSEVCYVIDHTMCIVIHYMSEHQTQRSNLKPLNDRCHHRVRVITWTTYAKRPAELQPTTRLSARRLAVCDVV